MFSNNDIIKEGFLAGIIGVFGDFLIHGGGFLFFRTTMTSYYISQLIFPLQEVTTLKFLLASLMHLLAGAFVGVFLAIIIKLTGKDFPYLKGAGLGAVMWIVHVAVIPNIITTPRPVVFRTELEALVDLLGHIVYGLLAAVYLSKKMVAGDNTKIH